MTCIALGACLACAEQSSADRSVQESAAIAADGGPTGSHDSLFAVAQGLYFEGHIDSAIDLLRRMRGRAAGEGAVSDEARALTWVGIALWRRGDLHEAWRVGQEALALKQQHQLSAQLYRSYNQLGLVAWHQGRNEEAVRLFEQTAEAARSIDNRVAEATAYGNLGLVQIELGQFADARRGFTLQRTVTGEVDSARLEGNALINLGMLEIRLGSPQGAVPYLNEALARFASLGYEYGTGVQSALGQLGTAYAALGDPARAFAALDSALAVANAQGLRQEQASIREAMAEIYRASGDVRRAIDLYNEAKDINAELGLDVETGIDLRGEADIHIRLGDLPTAEGLTREALVIHRGAGAPLEELRDLLMLAEVADRLGRPAEAAAHLDEARKIADRLGARIARVEVALAEARIADRNRRSERVLGVVDDIEPDLSRGGYQAEWEARLLASRAYARLGRMESAAAAGRRALATVERVRGSFGSGALRTAFVADKREVYGHQVQVLLRLGEVEEAFEVADAARGRALLERLAAAQPGRDEPTAALEEGEILLREIVALVENIDYLEEVTPAPKRSDENQRQLAGWYRRLERARGRYELLLVQANEAQPQTTAFLGGARVDADAVRRALMPGTVILEYFVPHEGPVVLFVVSPADVHVLETPITAENLTSRVRLARDLISRPDAAPDRVRGVLAGLHDALIGPVIRAGLAGDARELIVIPHDVLSYLPFAALLDRTTERFLVEDFVLRVLPSAASVPVLSARPGRDRSRRAAAFAPFPERLPATRDEVRAVAGVGGVRRFEGRQASEPALRRALGTPQLVHVATHGVMNAMNPMFSRLELARGTGSAGADDGRLEVHELLDLRVAAPLVFLSGCETGVGAARSTAFAPGEDYATLAQAFLYAGAENVIATLWPVEDDAAAMIAGRFYEELRAAGPAAALALAQRWMLSREGHASPYEWAAYQLAGLAGEP